MGSQGTYLGVLSFVEIGSGPAVRSAMVDMGARRRQRVSKCRSAGGPELFLVDPVAPFDLAVLLGAAGLDVPMSDPHGLNGDREGERKLLPLVALQLLDRDGKRPADFG